MMTDTFVCKACNLPFGENHHANQFEAGIDAGDHSFTARDFLSEEVVQLKCNPAHIFHKQCLKDLHQCPKCMTAIHTDYPEDYFFEEGETSHAQDSDEEDLLQPAGHSESDEEDSMRISGTRRTVSFR